MATIFLKNFMYTCFSISINTRYAVLNKEVNSVQIIVLEMRIGSEDLD